MPVGAPSGGPTRAERAALVILVALLLGLSAFALAIGFGWDPIPETNRFLAGAVERPLQWAFVGALALVLAGLLLRRAVVGLGEEPTIARETSLGEVRISLRAIETLVRRAAAQVEGIREAETRVRPVAGGGDVEVFLSLTVEPDSSIPQLSDMAQSRIEQYLRQTAGIGAQRITVTVRNIGGRPRQARAERSEP